MGGSLTFLRKKILSRDVKIPGKGKELSVIEGPNLRVGLVTCFIETSFPFRIFFFFSFGFRVDRCFGLEEAFTFVDPP